MKCETMSGGQLLNAAEMKQDERLLLDIRGKDLVAIEVKYHKSCYLRYTKVVQSCKSQTKEGTQQLHEKSYKSFCTNVVEYRIIRNKEILRLTKLNRLFVKEVKDVEGIDASSYKSGRLKARLRRSYPVLCFSKPSRQSESDIVFVETLDIEEVVEDVIKDVTTSEESEDSDCVLPDQAGAASNPIRELFHSAQELKAAMSTVKTPIVWPPIAKDMSLDRVNELVPTKLYNFLAWSTGLSEDINESVKNAIPEESHRRLLSVAQDLLYLRSRGRMLLPKHTSLAMAVRHMTGSAKLIGVLNGLGHSVSNSVTLEIDTAIAKRQLAIGVNILPAGSQPVFTTVVWDNNDFGEETLSGKGTTHNTNGILVQWPSSSLPADEQSTEPMPLPRTRERSFEPPESNIKKYFGNKRAGPQPYGADVSLIEGDHRQCQQSARDLDLALRLMKVADISDNVFPGWTGCNILLHNEVPMISTVGYLPIIDASPTEYDTVYTILDRSLQIADTLKQEEIVAVFDQAIYAKAQQIRWSNEAFSKRVVIRLGAFHTSLAMLACIGKRFRDAGLENLVIESGIVAQGSLNGAMNGHHYNRSVRMHKCVVEAMERIRFQCFIDSLSNEDKDQVLDVLISLNTSFPGAAFSHCVQSEDYNRCITLYNAFIREHRQKSPTFDVWSSYIEMVQVLLLFIRATRQGNWDLHLSAIRSFLPWLFAYGHINYSRYLPAYWLEMCELPAVHPAVYEEFAKGRFSVQRQSLQGFSQVACDQTIEQTCNRDTKTKGGMIGFTTEKGAVSRWILSHRERAAISKRCEEMAGKDETSLSRKDLQLSRMKRDEEDVCRVVSVVDAMINPFDGSHNELVHVSSGVVASKDVTECYIKAWERGDKELVTYCEERLQGSRDVFAPIKKMKTKTFKSMNKVLHTKAHGKQVSLQADRNLFQRLLIIANVRKLDIEKMVTYNLGPLPLSLAHQDGSMSKTNKASLLHYIESQVQPSPLTEIPPGSTWIVDAMAMLQELRQSSIPPTFGQLADQVLKQVVDLARSVRGDTIHFVVDTYRNMSIKNAERGRRGSSGSLVTKIYGEDQRVPQQWKKFLAGSENKAELIRFLFKTWSTRPSSFFHNVHIYVTHDEVCHELSVENGMLVVQEVPSLRCSQEEADTRMFLHAQFASRHPSPTSAIVIKSPDTDVFVIGVAKAKQIESKLLFHTGRGSNRRTLSLSDVSTYLGEDVCNALISFHCFTGCDSVSSFHGKSKAKAYKLMAESAQFKVMFQQLGSSFTVEEDVFSGLERFVCQLYGQECDSVNKARYNMFLLLIKSEARLPPTKDSLTMHIRRANYQATVHTCCLEQTPDIPSPHGHGWKVEDGEIDIVWGEQPPAPSSLLELTHCTCKKTNCKVPSGKNKGRCSCRQHNVPCTDLCKCTDCENPVDGRCFDEDTDIEDEDV